MILMDCVKEDTRREKIPLNGCRNLLQRDSSLQKSSDVPCDTIYFASLCSAEVFLSILLEFSHLKCLNLTKTNFAFVSQFVTCFLPALHENQHSVFVHDDTLFPAIVIPE